MSSEYARRRRLAIYSSEQSSASCVLICCRNQEPASFRNRHDCRARAAACVCAVQRDRGHSVLLIVLGTPHDTLAVAANGRGPVEAQGFLFCRTQVCVAGHWHDNTIAHQGLVVLHLELELKLPAPLRASVSGPAAAVHSADPKSGRLAWFSSACNRSALPHGSGLQSPCSQTSLPKE